MEHYKGIPIEDIITVFREFDGVYQKEMVDVTVARRDEIIPRLIEVLRQVTADPQEYIKDQDLFDHIYALMLLGHFRAAEAHDAIINLFSLPDGIPEDLFGDIISDILPVILLNTCGGSLSQIRTMAANRMASVACRVAALDAMAYAVAAGVAERQAVVSFLGTLFTGFEADPESGFWSLAAIIVDALYPEENMTVIENAYEQELISSDMISRADFERTLQSDRRSVLEQLRATLQSRSLDDLHAVMSGWSCFHEELDLSAAADPTDLYGSGFYGAPADRPAGKTDKVKKKRKRKTAQVSKRKNRPR